jgi:choline dehydrogenase-like flavoprotein
VLPDTSIKRVELDIPRVDAKIKECEEVVRAWHGKLSVKTVKTDLRAFNRKAVDLSPGHRSGTARAGSSPANSVCTSDYDCHDIDNLLFTSAATIPRTFFWSAGPTAVNAAYAWRRMVANHFSTGSSTKGFA